MRPFTDQQDCFFYFDTLKTWCGPKCFVGHLEQLTDFFDQNNQDFHSWRSVFPTFIWPEDRSWCFNSDEDLEFVVLGGSRELAAKVLESSEVESIQVQLNTRIDASADITNFATQLLSLADDEIAQNQHQAQE